MKDSDGTLILTVGPLTGGTARTVKVAKKLGKPHLVVDLSENPDPDTVREWIEASGIKILNVGGPRESKMPGIHDHAVEFLRRVF